MEYRVPSSLAATEGVLRRRSGTYLQRDEVEDELPEDIDIPTVLLVRWAPSSPPLLGLSRFSSWSTSPPVSARAISPVDASELDRPFSPVPLTPRPDAPQRALSDASLHSISTTSTIPPLPTPDFTRQPRFLALFPRGLSFLSYTPRPFFSLASSSESEADDAEASQLRPRGVRSDSDGSSSTGSAYSNTTLKSLDSGHHGIIKDVGTTDKFTHKWPRPQSLRAYSLDDAAEAMSHCRALGLVEDGQGLGIDIVEPWTGFKWCLLLSVCTVFTYGAAALVCALMTWFRTWDQADVMTVADNDILILITLAGAILVFTALVGLSGVLLNSRPILAVYTLLLWPAFASIVAIGYLAYKRATFSLDHKLNMSWSQYYTPLGRLFIQNSLRCCGFYSALHEATPSKRCYPRTSLPGCKGKLYRFERANLALVWSTVFSLVPLHLLNVLVALLCANHVTETFGKGITPKMYRLTSVDVQADAEKIMRRVKEDDVPSGGPPLSEGLSNGCFLDVGHREEHREDTVPFLSYGGHQY